MRITVLLFAGLREAAGARSVDLEVPDGATPETVVSLLRLAYPGLAARTARLAYARNNDYISADTPLAAGDQLALIPPVSGGSVETAPKRFEIVETPIDPLAVQAKVADPRCGAIVVFNGVVRDHSQGKAVSYLEYEAFAEMAEAKLAELGAEVRARFGLDRVAISHRVGRLEIGEISVCIAVAAPHRGIAFDACEWTIDRLKEVVPIWKKEVTPTGEYWVEPHA